MEGVPDSEWFSPDPDWDDDYAYYAEWSDVLNVKRVLRVPLTGGTPSVLFSMSTLGGGSPIDKLQRVGGVLFAHGDNRDYGPVEGPHQVAGPFEWTPETQAALVDGVVYVNGLADNSEAILATDGSPNSMTAAFVPDDLDGQLPNGNVIAVGDFSLTGVISDTAVRFDSMGATNTPVAPTGSGMGIAMLSQGSYGYFAGTDWPNPAAFNRWIRTDGTTEGTAVVWAPPSVNAPSIDGVRAAAGVHYILWRTTPPQTQVPLAQYTRCRAY